MPTRSFDRCHPPAADDPQLRILRVAVSDFSRLLTVHRKPSAVPFAGPLAETNPLDVLNKGEQLDFAPLFEDSENFAVTASVDTLARIHVADGDSSRSKTSPFVTSTDIVDVEQTHQRTDLNRSTD